MRRITDILGVPFDVISMDEAVKRVIGYLSGSGQHMVCTPNPEIVMEAQEDKELMNILNAADLIVPDGIGIVMASKFCKEKIKERVAGYDLVQNIFEKLKDTEYKVYFFGGAPGVASTAAKKMSKKYPGLSIVGTRNGYFSSKDEKDIIDDIKRSGADLLLVGLGAPKQEKWIYENMRLTGAKVSIGVGGSFDVMSGKVKRAPVFFQKCGLEWFYRLLCQPTRLKRMLKLPKFVLVVFLNKLGIKK